jgi:hypothetical protein
MPRPKKKKRKRTVEAKKKNREKKHVQSLYRSARMQPMKAEEINPHAVYRRPSCFVTSQKIFKVELAKTESEAGLRN